MPIAHIALISETTAVRFANLVPVAAAIQKQVARDMGPIWNIQATVDAFDKLENVPLDYWRVIIRDDIGAFGQSGFHRTSLNQPYAFVQFDDDWSITASHEVLEMLVDPSGNRLVAGASLIAGQGRVNYLVEICDPVQADTYTVNDIRVCDFYTPQYFDPVNTTGARYSFTGTLTGPRQVRKGGYLAFHDPVGGHWFQQQWFDTANPEIVDLGQDTVAPTGALRTPSESLREMMDRLNRQRRPYNAATKKPRKRKASLSLALRANAAKFREDVSGNVT
jgi:hypothetical protein